MSLRNLGGGWYEIDDSGWRVYRETWASASIWNVYDDKGQYQFHRTTRAEAVSVARGVLAEMRIGDKP